MKASDEVIKGIHDSEFVVDIFQTGSGTSTNMNANEVIATLANRYIKGKGKIHPNDHVNKSQSTNDVFPTAMHIAIAIRTKGKLLPSLKLLNSELQKKSKQFKKIN